ncbi:hypothetical protein Q3O97_05890 [Ralstonia pseudosolanacearum]|uniref:hypothetical protein n=1 Tax=Ralstonia pseudosolanacearum TaxID=1310165 RepID=UPI00270F7C08|nr:hypothetical protein [Ralstonia pseudosolanacearum]MDO3615370.1 hypothetical protein [Ralstonia pseudosolanacearum]
MTTCDSHEENIHDVIRAHRRDDEACHKQMKISKRKQKDVRAIGTSLKHLVIVDEWHLAAPVPDLRACTVEERSPSLIATQALIKGNSGKRIRLIGTVRLANGDPVKPAPKKFLPAQVLRRQSQS